MDVCQLFGYHGQSKAMLQINLYLRCTYILGKRDLTVDAPGDEVFTAGQGRRNTDGSPAGPHINPRGLQLLHRFHSLYLQDLPMRWNLPIAHSCPRCRFTVPLDSESSALLTSGETGVHGAQVQSSLFLVWAHVHDPSAAAAAALFRLSESCKSCLFCSASIGAAPSQARPGPRDAQAENFLME